jgi:WD40 repeat protein
MSSTLHRIQVPSFDLHWFDEIPEGVHNYIFLPGGGGSAKTGVKNQIMVAEYQDEDKAQIQFRESCFTDTETRSSLCSGISSGSLPNNSKDQEVSIACALIDNFCSIYKLSQSKNNDTEGGLQFDKICEFAADFHEQEPVLNVSIVTSTGCIVTGGDDTVVRVWALKESNSKQDTSSSSTVAYQALKLYEMKQHQSPVSALHEHPSKPWVVSSSKDGLVAIWDFETGKMLVDIPPVIEGVLSAKTNPAVAKLECRGCCFSPNESNVLYTMQSPKRGATFVIMWEIIQAVASADPASDRNERITELSVRMRRKRQVASVPCTRLRISADGQYLAVGCSDGSVTILSAGSLSAIQKFAHHDLPVTGLTFAPQRVLLSERGERTQALLASCSADNKLVIMRVQKGSLVVSILIAVVVLLILAILILFSHDISHMLHMY